MRHTIYTLGYSRWQPDKRIEGMVSALVDAGITTLVDIRLSPCSSSPTVGNQYGPKAWTLQHEGEGIRSHLQEAGIKYLWLPELGNPQKNDHAMRILREHISDLNQHWPVHRGLTLLRDLVESDDESVCILCTCADYRSCHRSVISEALSRRFYGGALNIQNLE